MDTNLCNPLPTFPVSKAYRHPSTLHPPSSSRPADSSHTPHLQAHMIMLSKSHPSLSLPFSTRADQPNASLLATYLLSLISIKRSNLCVSADVHTTYDLLSVAEEIGDHICVLKTHADIIDDWSQKTIAGLQEISRRKRFLLFEDRKLGDIGSKPRLILHCPPPPLLHPQY